jgi:hypothetical protein
MDGDLSNDTHESKKECGMAAPTEVIEVHARALSPGPK